jgi:hypothetical protein
MNKSELHQRERDAEVRLTGDRPIEKEGLIGPMRNVSALCNLYRSVVCLYILYIPLNAYNAYDQVMVYDWTQATEGCA